MNLPQLLQGRLCRRYKRFLADVELADGRIVTVHVANTGAMLGCSEAGSEVWLRPIETRARIYDYSLFLVKADRSLVCVNTHSANSLALEAIQAGRISELAGYLEIIPEVPFGEGSRADFCCRVHEADMLRRCWVEVKSVTLARGRQAAFPDAVSARGRRHLNDLQARAEDGDEALQLFIVQRSDVDRFSPADDIDPAYGAALREAAAAGVRIAAYRVEITKRKLTIERPIPVIL